ncbi:MAG: S1 RNA-binding domain-containing protein [Bacilli bacterium]|jgi:general stress protein 13
MAEYKIGDIVEGTCTKVINYGAFLIFDDDVQGLLHISEISNQYIYNIANKIKVGIVYRVKVIEVSPDGTFLKVSMKQITDEDLEKIRMNGNNRLIVNEDDLDFSSLKENLDIWTKEKNK